MHIIVLASMDGFSTLIIDFNYTWQTLFKWQVFDNINLLIHVNVMTSVLFFGMVNCYLENEKIVVLKVFKLVFGIKIIKLTTSRPWDFLGQHL
jgi:hypothetical protein